MKRAALVVLLLAAGCSRTPVPATEARPAPPLPSYQAVAFDAARKAGATVVVPVVDCTRPLGARVDEGAGEVRVTLGLDPANPLPCEPGDLTARLTIRLGSPLGARRLVDGSSGRAVAAFDSAKLLVPPALPAPFDAGRRDEGGSGELWQLSWSAGDFAVAASAGTPAAVPAPRECPGRRSVTVRGVAGVACVGPGRTVVTWTDGGLPRELSVGWSEAADAGPPPIGLARLLRIAETLRPLG